ncbi:universal stress protein [Haloterrigena sp. SYSU A558-1]|uniref:Universal stress protein n=1 Tax=Haloterrigena gelatinilytica TaxID=2741724 RepID=A0A8J8GPP1_9EURY|nr:universal stress protein [Haloterrigena gelatinilytica]NUB92169.1 universal stress protein [Haloterrigena gelatinilytica]NUC72001.1 universal stress protein [Haloterrigena gelatinilytica]
MTLSFDGPILVPVATPEDGERTAAALAPYLADSSRAIVVNVIEKAGGAPDKAGMEQREEYAEEIFGRARGPLEATDATVETAVLYGTDVVERIFAEAEDREVDAVVFAARKGNRLAELLTGDVARRLVKEASVPVVALPLESSSEKS